MESSLRFICLLDYISKHAELCFVMQVKYHSLFDDMQKNESLLRLIETTDFILIKDMY